MKPSLSPCLTAQRLQALDQAIYNLWRLYGYSAAYWQLENARLNFEKSVFNNIKEES